MALIHLISVSHSNFQYVLNYGGDLNTDYFSIWNVHSWLSHIPVFGCCQEIELKDGGGETGSMYVLS